MRYNGKYVKPSGFSGAVLMRVAFVLLCMLMISIYLMGGLLAKYNNTGAAGNTARVAKFEVNVSGTPQESDIVCTSAASGNGTYTITIENKSEVVVHYELLVAFSGDTTGVSHSITPSSGNLAVGATGSSTLTFTVDWGNFTANKTGSSASTELSFTVTVNVTQVD